MEGISPTAIADTLAGALWEPVREQRDADLDDVRAAAASAYELGRLGLGREAFLSLIGSR